MTKQETYKRLFYALFFIIIFIPAFILNSGNWYYGRIIGLILFALTAMVALYEILNSTLSNKYISLFSTLIVPIVLVLPWHDFNSLLERTDLNLISVLIKRSISSWQVWITILVFSLFPLLADFKNNLNNNYFLKQIIVTFSMFIIIIFSKIFWVFNIWDFKYLVYFLFIPIISDTVSYFGGMFFGKKVFNGKKLAPKISPKKTLFGFLLGLFFTLIFSILGGYFMRIWKDFGSLELLVSLLAGILLSLVAPIGDLAFSLIKRKLNIKDFSNLIPGHGGIMDRVDSMSFVFFVSGIIFLFVLK